MASTFLLKIITPDHEVYNDEVEKVFLKSVDGGFEVLANHENLISSTIPCIAKFKDSKGIEYELFISTSIVHITGTEVIICSDAAEFEEDIDEQRAKEAIKRAEKRLEQSDGYNKDRAESALFRAKQRLILKKSVSK
jgi:F-type H+-transporting ATPase subunit epsilon